MLTSLLGKWPILKSLTLSVEIEGKKTLTRYERETGGNFVYYLLRGVFQSHRLAALEVVGPIDQMG